MQAEKHKLRFIVVAPHTKTIEKITEELLKEGYFLSQIKFLYNNNSTDASVFYDPDTDDATVKWELINGDVSFQNSSDFETLGDIFNKIANADSNE